MNEWYSSRHFYCGTLVKVLLWMLLYYCRTKYVQNAIFHNVKGNQYRQFRNNFVYHFYCVVHGFLWNIVSWSRNVSFALTDRWTPDTFWSEKLPCWVLDQITWFPKYSLIKMLVMFYPCLGFYIWNHRKRFAK
jgi:hypothetical protein